MQSHCNSYFRSLRSKPLKESRSWSHRRAPVAAGSARESASPFFLSLRSKPQKSVHPDRTHGLLLQRARRAWTRLQFWRFAQNRRRVFILVAFQSSCYSGLGARGRIFNFGASRKPQKSVHPGRISGAPVAAGSARKPASPFSYRFATNRLKCPFSILSHPDGLMLRVARRARRSHHVVASVRVFQDWQEHCHEDRQEAWREAWRERVQQMLVPLTIWRAAIRLAGASERSAFYKYLCGGRAYAT
jgi:hypothetical protein